MKTALFVDFDNAYLGLERLSYDVAARFGQNTRQWLRWLAEEFPCTPAEKGDATAQRRILIRRCYLNPVSFARFRRPFLEAGFDVIDCPPMTAAGKTSTDVHMVLDMVDALQHPTGFDEFIVFSADADFSPVLRRLRTNNRQTVVFAAGNMSEAYRASADVHIDIDTFIFDGLGYPRPTDKQDEVDAIASVDQADEQESIVQREDLVNEIERIVKSASEPVPLSKLAGDLNRRFGNLAAGKWLGAGTFTNLLATLGLQGVRVDQNNKMALDLARQDQTAPQVQTIAPSVLPVSKDKRSSESTEEIVALIQGEVLKSETPVKYVRMAQLLDRRFPGLKTDWMGYTSFRNFVSSLDLGELKIGLLPDAIDRVIYDPHRHTVSQKPNGDPLVASIFRAAKLPQISALDFCSILNVFWATLTDEAFDISASSNATYGLCARLEKSPSISIQMVTATLQGLVLSGFDTRKNYASSEDLQIDAYGVVLAAWARENLVSFVDNDTRLKFMDWISDGAELAIRLERLSEN